MAQFQKRKGITSIGKNNNHTGFPNRMTTESGSEDDAGGNGEVVDAIVVKRGKSRAAANINVKMLFVVNEAGEPIGGHRTNDIRDHARTIWQGFLSHGVGPKKWKTDVSLECSQYYRCVHYN